jgi:hypothetical protein
VDYIRLNIKNVDFKPNFVYSLNNINQILDNEDEYSSTITGPIEWLTVNPGTQMVGSFNPITSNFYEDAYTRSKQHRELIKKAMDAMHDAKKNPHAGKKMLEVTWSWDSGRGNFQSYSAGVSGKLEKTYRDYIKSQYTNHTTCDVSKTHYVDFTLARQVSKQDTRRTRKIEVSFNKKCF